MSSGKPSEPSRFSFGTGFLMILALSLGISAGQGWLENTAQAQQFPRGPQGAYQGAPITGSAYQNQASASAGQTAGPQNVMIILDGSDSMSENIGYGHESKMVAAKRTVLEVLRNIPSTTRVGLRVYGNSASPFTACHATDLLVPLGQNNRNLIASKMIGIQPTGMTPISYTILRSLNEDFQTVGNGPKTIILISDGIETCGEDPCHVAVRMQQMGINVKINVIGLGLQDYEANKQLRCVALGTKGQFYSANTAAELAQSLGQAMAVETNVQGTIMTPTSSVAPVAAPAPAPAATTAPTAKKNPKAYQDTYLPAVPIQPNKR